MNHSRGKRMKKAGVSKANDDGRNKATDCAKIVSLDLKMSLAGQSRSLSGAANGMRGAVVVLVLLPVFSHSLVISPPLHGPPCKTRRKGVKVKLSLGEIFFSSQVHIIEILLTLTIT